MRVTYNFSAGPAMLPRAVLEASAQALLDYQGLGAGIGELSHRGPEFDAVLDEAIARCRQLLAIPDAYDVLFLQGGATQLFSTIPMNFLAGGDAPAAYALNGEWSLKAAEAAHHYGQVQIAASSEATNFDRIPDQVHADPAAAYLYLCSNETIYGTRWDTFPTHHTLIADVSSEFMARPLDVSRFGMIFGGAQKNLGPAGLVLAIVRSDLYGRIPADVPDIFSFAANARARSCLNTPPTFSIYMLLETFRWLERQGGLTAMERRNEAKASTVYGIIDEMPDFYAGTVHDRPGRRSRMNVTFRLPDGERTSRFLEEAEAHGMIGLKGYRTVGGIRASIYNAMPQEGCEALASFMRDFARRHAGARPAVAMPAN
jgi:phosphoserine aminotransferase